MEINEKHQRGQTDIRICCIQCEARVPVSNRRHSRFSSLCSLHINLPTYCSDIFIIIVVVLHRSNSMLDTQHNGIKAHSIIIVYLNPLNPELNPICYLLALLGAHHFIHVSRIRVKLLTFRRLMSYIYIYGAPILDVSRSHTTTQHSR